MKQGDQSWEVAMPDTIVLAIHADHADAILDGTAHFEHRAIPPKRLPAKAYLAVVEEHAVVGECELGAPARRSAQGWALPVSKPRRYRSPKALAEYGLEKIPRSFRYV
jgi:predicted transcriptional regulator